MLDHSDNANNPYCTDCHIVYDGENASIRIHDAGLVVPERSYYVGTDGLGMYNSTMCRSCHNQSRYEIHANDSDVTPTQPIILIQVSPYMVTSRSTAYATLTTVESTALHGSEPQQPTVQHAIKATS
jgi:hypothetical protein